MLRNLSYSKTSGIDTNPYNKQGNNMLSVVIGNDIKDVEKLNTAIDKLQQLNNDDQTDEVIDWLKGIHNILTDKNFGQEMYDASELLDETL